MSKYMKQAMLLSFSLLAAIPGPVALAQGATTPAALDPSPVAPADAEVDTRRGIMTRPNERTHILANMRKYLIGLQLTSQALAADDMPAAISAARSMGSINLYEVRLRFANAAALEFRQLAEEVHHTFDAIAKEAQEKQDPKLMLSRIGAVMKKCTHCHETYRLQDMAH
ncbi:MAG: cytochrome c [Burkholderiaceae bacterium]|nr:cytochrome c [Burkholderiaceae bacterium]